MDPSTKKAINEAVQQLSTAVTMATGLVCSSFAGVWFGYFLDTKVFDGRTHPWLTLIFLFFGIAGGIRGLFVMAKRFQEKEDQADHSPGDDKSQ